MVVKSKQKENSANSAGTKMKKDLRRDQVIKGVFVREAGLRAPFPPMKARREYNNISNVLRTKNNLEFSAY